MAKFFEYGLAGASLGGIIGGAVGTLLAGSALLIPGVNAIAAPLTVAAVTTTASGTAIGTVVGGTGGAIAGAVEDAENKKN